MTDINPEHIDKEILPFLSPSARTDVRSIALQYFLGLTGTAEGQTFISVNEKYLLALIAMLKDEQPAIAKDAYLALVNLTTDETVSMKLLNLKSNSEFLSDLLKYILEPDSQHADPACMILCNLSRSPYCADTIVKLMIEKQSQIGFDKLIQVFCTIDYNKNAKLHYLGPFLSNLTQIQQARHHVLDKERCVIQRLLPYTQYNESLVRRGGIIGTLKNCCFETAYHDWLLSDAVDILPRLLLPLAGPEEFDEEDTGKLPDDLQYLEPDKEREKDPDIRQMLVESVHQLLATQPCREYIRKKNAYVILRELDNWEKNTTCKATVQNTISIIIADDPEQGMEDLSEVEIPEHIKPKLDKAIERQQRELDEEQMENNEEKR